MRELDHLNIDLSGMNLIEASAGTGKTYAIACLYLRLLLERDLTPEQILVVTYTEAATKELRGRIRERIREALAVLEGRAAADPFLLGVRERSAATADGTGEACRRLERALACFDTAAIFTIHGFCLRALQDNAFESGSLYDTELVTDQKPLLREVVEDFWRSRFFSEPAPLLTYALRQGYSCDSLLAFLTELGGGARQRVIPAFTPAEIAALDHDCHARFADLVHVWATEGERVRELLTDDPGLSRAREAYRRDLLPKLFRDMDDYCAGTNPYELFDGFDRFTGAFVARGTKKGKAAPKHPLFEHCQLLLAGVERRFAALRGELVDYCREQLPRRKRERNQRFFDDLLADLYLALQDENGPLLAATLAGKYRAALIDEFQDTDPLQYDIFRLIHAAGHTPLFLIGDPKQAIYSFRGADIFAYLQASRDVPPERRFTLTSNWRSTPRLLTAFNRVFDPRRNPFVFERIGYHPLSSGRPGEGTPLTMDGAEGDGLQIWYLPEDGGEPLGVGRANRLIPRAVAAEIAALLRRGELGSVLIGERPLAPRDVAVIVRSHRQAGMIREALTERGIASVMRSDRSVFASREAGQLLTLLHALVEPGDEAAVRAALVTDMLGLSGDRIASLSDDEAAWEEWLRLFRDHHRLWLDRGFMVMFRSLMARQGVRGRLLVQGDGERRLTNLLHCVDLIHCRAHEGGLGMEGLLGWFGERIATGEEGEEYQLRLETDEMAVKIVTIHVSKGLEYPVVFCPFFWNGLNEGGELLSFHDGDLLVRDYGSADYERHRALARREALAENLRLLYVALTRARHRCYLCGGKVGDRTGRNRPETSPLAYLFHASPESRGGADPVAALATEVAALGHGRMTEQLGELAAGSGGSILLSPLPDPDRVLPPPVLAGGERTLLCRSFSGALPPEWRVASFTSFCGQGRGTAELPDRDEVGAGASPSGDDEAGGEPDMFRFPRGARAGIFLHALFEELDFHDPDPRRIHSLVAGGLERHGYGSEWLSPVAGMVAEVVSTPLSSSDGEFTLSGLEPGSWLCELEFFFPLRFVTPELLADCLTGWGGAADLERVGRALDFTPVRGMVRGFMDMVFRKDGRYYLLDWKSNHLGNRLEDYGPERLKAAMEASLYPLQYLLYTVALNRYLALRVPGYDYATHFGGVLYVFLRGVSSRHGERYGFYRDLPDSELVRGLTDRLIRAGGDR